MTGTNGKTTTVRCSSRSCARPGGGPLAVGNIGVPLIDAVVADPALRRAGRRAVQLPAALVVDWPRWPARCSTWPRTTSTGTARSTAYAEAKAAIWRGASRGRQRRRPAGAPLLGRAPRARRVGVHPADPAAGSSAWRRACWSTARSATATLCRRVATYARPGAQRRQRAGRRGPGARRTACRAAAVGERAARLRARSAPQPVRASSATGSTTSTTARRRTRTRRSRRCARYPRIVWIAGGQLKGAPSTNWSPTSPAGWRGAVLLGVDRDADRAALARHAPGCPGDRGRPAPTMGP